MGFLTQLLGLIKRNFILKYRNKFQLISGIIFPLTMLFFLIVLNFMFSEQVFKEAYFLPEPFPSDETNKVALDLYIISNDNRTKHIINHLRKDLNINSVRYFQEYNEMRKRYIYRKKLTSKLKTQSYGIEFSDQNFPFEYTIYKEWSADLFYKNSVNLFDSSYQCERNSSDIMNVYTHCAGNRYVYDGLSAIKYYIDIAIKSYAKKPSYTMPKFSIQNMPKHSHIHDKNMFAGIASYYFSLFFVTSLMTFTTNIVAEREKNIKHLMKTMGMYESAFW